MATQAIIACRDGRWYVRQTNGIVMGLPDGPFATARRARAYCRLHGWPVEERGARDYPPALLAFRAALAAEIAADRGPR